MNCQITVFKDDVIDVQIPLQTKFMVLEIAVNGGQKLATLDNDLHVNVPMFINSGEEIIVSTVDGKYVSRA
jgi:elongation factor P